MVVAALGIGEESGNVPPQYTTCFGWYSGAGGAVSVSAIVVVGWVPVWDVGIWFGADVWMDVQ